MSLAFGKVKPADWDKVRKGSSGDVVDAGDYFGALQEVRHMDPDKSKKGLGAFIVAFVTTDENDEQWREKQLESFISYHPNPSDAGEKADGYTKMNEMSMTNLVQLVDACNVEPVVGADDSIDVVETLKKAVPSHPKVLLTVSHEMYQGKQQQHVGNFRPISG